MNMEGLGHSMGTLSPAPSDTQQITRASKRNDLKIPHDIQNLLTRLSKNWKHIDSLEKGSYEWAQKTGILLRSEERLNALLEEKCSFTGNTISFGTLVDDTDVVAVEEYNECNLLYFRIFGEYWKGRETGEDEENFLRESNSWKNMLRDIEREERMIREWKGTAKATKKTRPYTPVKDFVTKVAREPPFLWSLEQALFEMRGDHDESGDPSHGHRQMNGPPTSAQSESSIRRNKLKRRAISIARLLDFATQDLDPNSANWYLLAQRILLDQQRLEKGKGPLHFRSAHLQSIKCFQRTHFFRISYELDRGIRVPRLVHAGVLHEIDSRARVWELATRTPGFRPETDFERKALERYKRANEENIRAAEMFEVDVQEYFAAKARLKELKSNSGGLAVDRLNEMEKMCDGRLIVVNISRDTSEHSWEELRRAADLFENMERTKLRRGR